MERARVPTISRCNLLCTDNIVSSWHDTVGRRVKALVKVKNQKHRVMEQSFT
jgi:hypothetical protein